ncbi:bifunctional diguanylate cyclase/phosphodiesterase [Persephonella sp.]
MINLEREKISDHLMSNVLFSSGKISLVLLKNSPKWEFENWSDNISYLIGYTPEEIKNKKLGFLDIVHPEEKEKLMKSFQTSRKNRSKTFNFSRLRLIKKDGSLIWVDIKLVFLADEKDRVSHFFGYVLDVTVEVEEKNLLETLTDIVPVGIYLHEWGKFIYMNKRALEISGYTREDLSKMDSMVKVIYPEDRVLVEKIIESRKKGNNETLNYRVRIITKDNKVKWIQITSKVLYYKGRLLGIGIVQDIDKIVQFEFVKDLLSKVNKSMLAVKNKQGLIEKVCLALNESGNFKGLGIFKFTKKKAELKCGFSKNNFINEILKVDNPEKKVYDIKKPIYISDLEKLKGYEEYKRILKNSKVNSVIILPIKSGKRIDLTLSLYIEEKNYYSVDVLEVFNEIAENISFALKFIKQQETLFYKEYFDTLTGLGNKNYFLNNISKYINKKRDFYLLMIDIYNFKFLNESMGREYGDVILKEVAKKLDTQLTYENVFRGSNDEFIIISTSENIYQLLEKIKRIFKDFKLKNRKIEIDFNIGIVKFPEDGNTKDDLILKAERTLELAKKKGKNEIFFFDKDRYESIKKTFFFEKKLEEAIKNDEFHLYFQPIVSVKNNKIKGFEVLLRWIDSEGNLIPPSEFIPIAEKTGQIKEIDKIVIKKVLDFLYELKKLKKKNLDISVNITPSNISGIIKLFKENKIFKNEDIKLLKEFVTFELTERESMEFYSEKENINILKEMGFKISVDDFGTGYSSLNYLAELNVNYLKIDMIFIQKMLKSEKVYKLVQSIINIAKIFGILVVAEGVETEDQLKELKKLKCDLYQGYLFSKPVPQSEIFNFLK